jgi:hypothetical protein
LEFASSSIIIWMLRHSIPLGISLLAAFPCGVMAQSQQYSQPQIENSKLAK